jgi:hypothetical protein
MGERSTVDIVLLNGSLDGVEEADRTITPDL